MVVWNRSLSAIRLIELELGHRDLESGSVPLRRYDTKVLDPKLASLYRIQDCRTWTTHRNPWTTNGEASKVSMDNEKLIVHANGKDLIEKLTRGPNFQKLCTVRLEIA